METWRLLDVEVPKNVAMNVAIDEAVLLARIKNEVSPTVRFWRNERAVAIGYSQSVEAEVNLELCEEMGIQVVRRFSGGGAVYHDLGNLNYTVVVDAGHQCIRNLDIARSYEVLCSGVINGLKQLGAHAEFRPLSDLYIGNRKVSGAAQSRKRGVVLHHGTLLVDADLDLLVRSLDAPLKQAGEHRSTSVKRAVTNLKDALKTEIDITTLKRILKEGFEEAFSVNLIPSNLSTTETEVAQELCDRKYSWKEWNFHREEKYSSA